jgi:hypothetical protein
MRHLCPATAVLYAMLAIFCDGMCALAQHNLSVNGPDRAMQEAIVQNTRRNNQAHPAGVPKSWPWYYGKSGRSTAVPAPKDFSAVTGWGIIYPEEGQSSAHSSAEIIISGLATYLHSTSGGWVEAQNQAKDAINGGHFAADFSGNVSTPLAIKTLPDRSAEIDAPPSGHNDHFWLAIRGLFEPGSVDGVFVTAKIKVSDLNSNLIGALGADWWKNSSAKFEAGFSNNPGVGQSNFVRLKPEWQTLYFYSITTQQLQADPPPFQ